MRTRLGALVLLIVTALLLSVGPAFAETTSTVFVSRWPGATFTRVSDVALAPDGSLWVSDPTGVLVHLSAAGERLAVAGSPGTSLGQLASPGALDVAPDGSVYVCDTGNNRIQRFAADGHLLDSWGGPGTAAGQLSLPDGIDVTTNGLVYVSDTGNERIQVFDADGNSLAVLSMASWAGYPGPEGLEVAADGSIWIAAKKIWGVVHMGASGEYLGPSFRDVSAGYSWQISDLALAGDGTVHVADPLGHRVQVWSQQGELLRSYGGYGFGPSQMCAPVAVAAAPDGSVYVAESGAYRVHQFGAAGQHISDFGPGSTTGLRLPAGAACAPDGTVYVADTGNHRVQHYSATGTHLGGWGEYGTLPGQFNEPHGVAVGPDGSVYVSEKAGSRVQRFSPTGEYLGGWGTTGSAPGQFYLALAIAVAPDRTVYVADSGNGRIQRFTAEGEYLGGWNTINDWPGSVGFLSGITVMADGSVWASASQGYFGLQHYTATGEPIDVFSSLQPSGIAVSPTGQVFVSEANSGCVKECSSGGVVLRTLGSLGSGGEQFDTPMGLALSPRGELLVADSGNGRIQVLGVAPRDAAAPTSTLRCSSLDEWSSRPVTFTIDATDGDGLGVARTEYRLDHYDELREYEGTVTIAAEGAYLIEYRSTDEAGNTEHIKFASILVDMTAPQTACSVEKSYDSSATVPLTASDAMSGVATTYWRIDTGAWQTGTLATTSEPGSHTLEYYSVDVAGNAEVPVGVGFSVRPPRVEQTDPRLYREGVWKSTTSPPLSGGSDIWTNTPGGAVNIAFTGSEFTWISTKAPMYGKARVILDGSTETTVDLYAAKTAYQQAAFSRADLEPGAHTVRIEWTGEKNPAATGTTIRLDGVEVMGTIVQAGRPRLRFEQTDTRLLREGAWNTTTSTALSAETDAWTNSSGGALNVAFEGTGFTWVSTKAPMYGVAKVTVDGSAETTVDLYATPAAYQQAAFEIANLTDGPHTVRIEWTGHKNVAAGGTVIRVDAVEVTGVLTQATSPRTRFEQTDVRIRRGGIWKSTVSTPLSGGSDIWTNAAGGSADIAFTGTAFSWISTKAPMYGRAKVTFDGSVETTVDLYASGVRYQQQVFSRSGLAPGPHTVRIEWTGDKNSAATGTMVRLDAIEVLGVLTQAP